MYILLDLMEGGHMKVAAAACETMRTVLLEDQDQNQLPLARLCKALTGALLLGQTGLVSDPALTVKRRVVLISQVYYPKISYRHTD